MKKWIALLLAAVMMFSLAACGGSASSTPAQTPAESGNTAASTPAASTPTQDGNVATLTICGTNGPGDTQSIAHENFAKALNDCGDWAAVAMVSSEMGSTDDVLEQAMAGAPVIAATDPARLASYVPEFGILMMPYMFDSYDELDGLMETDLYHEWVDKLREQGLVLLTNNCITGFRNYVSNKEVLVPADLNGLKIRTMGATIAVNSVNAMGAIATALNQSEAYNGIETGVVDGGEWQVPTIYSLRLYEVCSHISMTQHFLLTGSIVCGAAWYDTLTEQQQKELSELAVKCYGETKEMVLQAEEDYVKEMVEEHGVTVDQPDKEAFREATAYLYSDKETTGGVDFEALRDELYSQMGITR